MLLCLSSVLWYERSFLNLNVLLTVILTLRCERKISSPRADSTQAARECCHHAYTRRAQFTMGGFIWVSLTMKLHRRLSGNMGTGMAF